MAEENKAAEPKQQKAAEAAPKPAQAAAEAPAEAKAKKNKKISQMSLKEVEDKINSTKEKMGRLDSRYGKELLKRKEALAKK